MAADGARVMPAVRTRGLFEGGRTPGGKRVLTVQVSAGAAPRAEVRLTPDYWRRVAEPLVFSREAPGGTDGERSVFVCEDEPARDDVSLPGDPPGRDPRGQRT